MNKIDPYEVFKAMTLEECIQMWNESACDHYQRNWEMHGMEEESWWNHLSSELGAWNLVQAVLSSGENFNDADDYFFYDEDCSVVRSFSTKQELIEQIGDDFFIETLNGNN